MEMKDWNKFADRVYLYCLKMDPGTKIEITKIPNIPDASDFIKAVKESMYMGLLKQFHFDDDNCRFICRQAEWESTKVKAKY